MKNNKGFTLIETIVVVAVIGLTLPIIFAIIFTLMRQQVKIYRLSQIKRGGDYVINLMENTIRNRAVTIYESDVITDDSLIVCKDIDIDHSPSAGHYLYFLDDDKKQFGYKLDVNKIASSAVNLLTGLPYTVPLTSGKIIVSSFSISCSRNSVYSPASISLDFTVCYDTCVVSTRPEEVTSMHYQTKIKLRNN